MRETRQAILRNTEEAGPSQGQEEDPACILPAVGLASGVFYFTTTVTKAFLVVLT